MEKSLKIILFGLILGMISCVGEVKDQNAKKGDIVEATPKSTPISFDGLQYVNPVSNSKIELFFSEALTDAEEVIYEIYVNNSPIPIKVSNKSLNKNAQGLYLFTVTDLSPNTTYSFNMKAVPAGEISTATLNPDATKYATTYLNEMADFLGISSAQVGAGESGKTSVILKWVPAVIKGTSLNPKDSDPVQYEITYISQLGRANNLNNPNYTGADRKVTVIPGTLNNPPTISKLNSYPIDQLAPGTTYYFQVRAIHKGYITYGKDVHYKREQNTRYVTIKTLESTGIFDFQPSLVNLSSPEGELGLTNLDVSWGPASGDYYNYKVCYKKVASASDTPTGVDVFTDDYLATVINNPGVCVNKTAESLSHRITGLESYAYYQVKVLACKVSTCGVFDRIKSSLLQRRVMTNVAQFNGIEEVLEPQNETELDTLTINFDAPLVSSGYLNRFKLYCYNSLTDSSPVEIPLDGSTSSGTGKANCNGLTSLTGLPTTLQEYGSFNQIKLTTATPIDGTKTYCFSLLPSIYSSHLNQENLSSAVVKCITPVIRTPNIIQFPGKNNLCQTTLGKDFTVTWPSPSGGIYSKFVTFYKVKNSGNDFFNFQDAINAFHANDTSIYKWEANIDKNLTSVTLSNLIPGRSYSIGVLPYLESGASKIYGQFNVNVDECTLPLPIAKFDEWVDIFAVGPKVDGLGLPSSTGAVTTLLESLDTDGIPLEIKTNTDGISIDLTHSFSAAKVGSNTFDGVYGAYNGLDTNPLQQYSNNGIIRLAWKDVSIFNDSEKLHDYYSNVAYESTPNSKNSRLYGYKVYRSDDNMLTWVDLTARSDKNKFQTSANTGLLHSTPYQFRNRNNKAPNTAINIVQFTDFSVKSLSSVNDVDRARIYHYKVVPYFDGKPLQVQDSQNPSHHIIRVTLPPRNMALVHRMMANRTQCLEIDRDIDKKLGAHYSCEYNGLGATGLVKPWVSSNTVIDLGGDLLVDRFELSCPITRGDFSVTNSDSEFSGTRNNFQGLSDLGNNFKGCFNVQNSSMEGLGGTYTSTENYKRQQITPADCLGRSGYIRVAAGSSVCADPTRVNILNFNYPGSETDDVVNDCVMPNNNFDTFSDETNPNSILNSLSDGLIQSEYAAVYYSRALDGNVSSHSRGVQKYSAANGRTLQPTLSYTINTACSVNLAYVNNTGDYKPRWISVDKLFGGLEIYNGATKESTQTLWNKTIDEVRANPALYDTANVNAPDSGMLNTTRFNPSSTKLARIVTSNSAKLPSLSGLSYSQYQNICSTYKVQVGFQATGKSYVQTENEKTKHLTRKRDQIIASAWPMHYDETKVNELERGIHTTSGTFNGCVGSERLSSAGNVLSGETQLFKGDYLLPNYATSRSSITHIAQGSSSVDGNGSGANYSSEKCVSKFGVQDIVGNLSEVNSDEIFCDFTKDVFMLGTSASRLNSVAPSGSFPYYDPQALIAWVDSDPNTGSCSVNENGAGRSAIAAIGATISDIFNYGGLNPSVVLKSKTFDQASVNTTRNGDGQFLDFGQDRFAAKLNKQNTLRLDEVLGVKPASKYFNHILGIPLVCDDGAGCENNGSDNAIMSADKLANAHGFTLVSKPASVSILDYPVNNASISNEGISEIAVADTLNTSNLNTAPVEFVWDIDLGDPLDDQDNVLQKMFHTPGSGTPPSLVRRNFRVGRNNSLKIFSGGNYLSNPSRFTMHIDDTPDSRNFSGRCAVLINEN